MSDSIGLGLLLNILFWTVAVLAATGLASLAVIEYFPGRRRKGSGEPRGTVAGGRPAERREEDAGEPARYRKAS